MNFKNGKFTQLIMSTIFTSVLILGINGCSSDDDDDDDSVGFIQLYNASPNAPGIFLTIDKNDDDDFVEITKSKVTYAKSSSYLEYPTDNYDIKLSWNNDDNTDDLKTIYQTQLSVLTDTISFLVVTEDINSPEILTYDIPLIDDEDDSNDDLFNIRLLNLHSSKETVDIYLSESDETFNESELLGQISYANLTDNRKIAQDEYVFYITAVGSDEILYQSDEIDYNKPNQYIMVIRDAEGAGNSPYTMDKVSTAVIEYPDFDAASKFRIYNGILEHELLPTYSGIVDVHLDGIDDSAEISSVGAGEFSDSYTTPFGDYSIALAIPNSDDIIINNHLLTLQSNSDKTVFFYLLEEAVDEDGDGDVDEDGDGEIDEFKVTINSLVVDNSQSQSIHNHQIKIINLVDDFNNIKFYFVRSNEVIETAIHSKTSTYLKSTSITLTNNSYTVFAIGSEDSSDLILAQYDLTLDEDSRDLFLIIEENLNSQTGYEIKFNHQKN